MKLKWNDDQGWFKLRQFTHFWFILEMESNNLAYLHLSVWQRRKFGHASNSHLVPLISQACVLFNRTKIEELLVVSFNVEHQASGNKLSHAYSHYLWFLWSNFKLRSLLSKMGSLWTWKTIQSDVRRNNPQGSINRAARKQKHFSCWSNWNWINRTICNQFCSIVSIINPNNNKKNRMEWKGNQYDKLQDDFRLDCDLSSPRLASHRLVVFSSSLYMVTRFIIHNLLLKNMRYKPIAI